MASLGLDIGGANIKWFHSSGNAGCKPFAMWRTPLQLAAELIEIADHLPAAGRWAITMTGEMADIFEDRSQGVQTIVEQTTNASKKCGIESVLYYSIPGKFLTPDEAIKHTATVASANWHALAKWAATWTNRDSILIDIGTTTVDLIPIAPNRVATNSVTDYDRLRRSELVYLGVKRTPICALANSLPYAGTLVPVMREVFANTDDCSLLLNWTNEEPLDLDTCDGKPRTRQAAASRMARMIGLDSDKVTIGEARLMAEYVFEKTRNQIMTALETHSIYSSKRWIVSGHADRMLQPPPSVEMIRLTDRLGPLLSRVGPAYAICELLRIEPAQANRSIGSAT